MSNYRTRGSDTVFFASDYQFDYDTTLLAQGRYREWFWEGLQESQISYLHQPARVAKAQQEPVAYDGWEDSQPRKWQDEAACRDTDPAVFFEEGHFPKREYLKMDASWRRLCPQCPVREACLEAARESESVGVWGGVFRFHPRNSSDLHKIEEIDDRIPAT